MKQSGAPTPIMKRLGVGWVQQKRIPDRFPEVIVTVASDPDMIATVKLARSRGLRISVRAGGHSWIATWLRHGGMLIDLSQFNGIGRLQFTI